MAKKTKHQSEKPALTARDRELARLENALRTVADSLPDLNMRMVDVAVKSAKRYPAAACSALFRQFQKGNEELQAVIPLILKKWAAADVLDNLSALVFDDTKDDLLRMRASELLEELGQPIDPDVLQMSVPRAKELAEQLPGAIFKRLAEKDVTGALARFKRLSRGARLVLIHRLVEEKGAAAAEFLREAVREDEEVAEAAAIALGRTGQEFAGPLLLELERHPGREVQKAARKALFALREAGVSIPELPSELKAETPSEPRDSELPIFRCLLSKDSQRGEYMVTVARERPDGWLKVMVVFVDLWKRGIIDVFCRLDMSKSSFRRRLDIGARRVEMCEASFEECQQLVARGIRIAQLVGVALPYELQVGKGILGDIDSIVATIANPFRCERCGGALPEAMVERIKETVAYDNILIMPICDVCRSAESQ